MGLFFAFPWIQAFGCAFKPTNLVDIRYFPRKEQMNIEEETAHLQGKEEKDSKTHPSRPRAEHPDAPSLCCTVLDRRYGYPTNNPVIAATA